MPQAKKAEKRIRIPENLRVPFARIVSDEAYLRATDESRAIIGLVFDQVLPSSAFPRERMLDVYGGEGLLASVSDVLRSNVTGAVGSVADGGYRPIVEFGARLMLIHARGCGDALDADAMGMTHMRRCLESTIEYMEHEVPRGPSSPLIGYEAAHAVKYCRTLADKCSTEFDGAAATALVRFAIDYFDEIGQLNSICAYLADVFSIIAGGADAPTVECDGPRTRMDTPEMRRRWGDLLEKTCSGW